MSFRDYLVGITQNVVEQYGEEVTVTRTDPETGDVTTFTATCRPQPLTPTFVHRINEEGGENLDENDQRDFVFTGQEPVQRDLDTFTWDDFTWKVSTAAEQRLSGANVTVHALCVKVGVEAHGL